MNSTERMQAVVDAAKALSDATYRKRYIQKLAREEGQLPWAEVEETQYRRVYDDWLYAVQEYTHPFFDPEPWVIVESVEGGGYRAAHEPTMPVESAEYRPRSRMQWGKDERRKAKTWLFGIIYGMGSTSEQRQAAAAVVNLSEKYGFLEAQRIVGERLAHST